MKNTKKQQATTGTKFSDQDWAEILSDIIDRSGRKYSDRQLKRIGDAFLRFTIAMDK